MKINVLMFINGDLNTLLLDTPYLGVIYHVLADYRVCPRPVHVVCVNCQFVCIVYATSP